MANVRLNRWANRIAALAMVLSPGLGVGRMASENGSIAATLSNQDKSPAVDVKVMVDKVGHERYVHTTTRRERRSPSPLWLDPLHRLGAMLKSGEPWRGD